MGLQDHTNEIKDVNDMLQVVNQIFVPEPTLFDGCPVLLIKRTDGKKDVYIVWQEFGIAVHRYPGRYVYWLYKFDPSEEFSKCKHIAIISNNTEMYNNQNPLCYFCSAKEIAKAIAYITSAYIAEQELTNRTFNEEKPAKNDEPYVEDGEFRYNDRTGKEEWFPDWLGGVESEEEFWEH